MTFTSRPLLSLVTLEDGALSEEVIDSGFGLPSISLFRFSIAANFPSRANFSGFCGTCLAETSSFLPSSFDFSPLIPFPNSPAEPGSVSSFFSSFLLPSGGWQSPFFDDSAFSLDSTSAFESEPASLALFTSVVSSEDSFLQLPFFCVIRVFSGNNSMLLTVLHYVLRNNSVFLFHSLPVKECHEKALFHGKDCLAQFSHHIVAPS
mmetsp:Transcript_2059/g.4366  ORF Transcript_2059/g.4366 Transcript_2059/m.4366 type:complete len:206 (-) Transcript_2059:3791-4408(-)